MGASRTSAGEDSRAEGRRGNLNERVSGQTATLRAHGSSHAYMGRPHAIPRVCIRER